MFSRLHRYGSVNSYDVIKALALISMTIDHIGAFMLVDELWWRVFGHMMVPVWFFLVGYARSTKIALPIIVYAVLLTGVNVATYQPVFPLNVLFSIIFCRLMLDLCEKHHWLTRYPAELLVAGIMFYLVTNPFFEYGTLALGFALFGRMRRDGLHAAYLPLICLAVSVPYIGDQILAFGFDTAQSITLVMGTGMCCIMLLRFHLRAVELPQLLALPTLALSRYSLEYYILHRTLLQAIGAFILGVVAVEFSWIDWNG